ncbi:MAG: DUF222 domain-containing protein [Salinibacterium sp.]|nr:DUF222 domain-containing protein [Salinibacterium sp.]
MNGNLPTRTPEEVVRVTNRTTAREASEAVRVGRIVSDEAAPWLSAVFRSIIDGSLPIASADAIRDGLGAPNGNITEIMLTDAAAQLCTEAAALDPDRLHRRARELRDRLDESGIAERENARRAQRSLRFTKLSDGMSRATWLMDPETSAVFTNLFDRATSPRRGGPRFVSDDAKAQAEMIATDERTTEQLASDVFLELLQQGAAADSSQLLGSGGAVINVHVTQEAVSNGSGHGFLEGQPDPVSIATVERLTCSGAMVPILLDGDGQPLDLAREQRLYSRRQRRALAARDGGCMAPGCDRPPSWTEAHHIKQWVKHNGKTDISNGILLCRYHNLLFHNHHWEIEYDGARYWLIPPPDVDSSRGRILLESKNPLRAA